jgi:hypothetical protein
MKRDTPLDQDTLIERAQALARTIEAIAETEGAAKDAAASYKEEISTLRKEANRLARIVRTNVEEIECEGPLLEFAEPSETLRPGTPPPTIPGLTPDDEVEKPKARRATRDK